VTYSIIARDPATGQMGIATQSQAFAVGSSVPWALPGYGVIATQSMGEPMYGELGLDALRGGLTAPEALTALRAVDPHPERRQVAMLDGDGTIAVYTGDACIEAAGHATGEGCAALANMVVSSDVWLAMVAAYEEAEGSLALRLMAALHAAEAAGGDFRGRRSAAIVVVRAVRTGRPWRDQVVDLRVDDADDPVTALDALVTRSDRYHRMVEAFELALDGSIAQAEERLEQIGADEPEHEQEPDLCMWRALVLALAGREDEARDLVAALQRSAPPFVEALARMTDADLVPDPDVLRRVLDARNRTRG
jgi:uncharacterized Ntn-hydrolase superfamily protein